MDTSALSRQYIKVQGLQLRCIPFAGPSKSPLLETLSEHKLLAVGNWNEDLQVALNWHFRAAAEGPGARGQAWSSVTNMWCCSAIASQYLTFRSGHTLRQAQYSRTRGKSWPAGHAKDALQM